MKADLILYNGQVLTLDGKNSIKQAVAVKNGRITAVGSNDYITSFGGNTTELIDLGGRTLVPGFIDSHVHLVQTGLNTLGIDLKEARSISDVLDIIAGGVKEYDPKELVWGTGLEELKLKEKRFPTRYELDKVTRDRPFFISRVEYHIIAVNSYTLNQLNLPFNLKGIEKQSSVPNGILHHHASSIARRRLLEKIPEPVRHQGIKNAAGLALAAGITTVNAMEGGFLFHDMDVDHLLKIKNSLPIDVELFFQTTEVEKACAKGLHRIGGCIFLDGSIGSHTAALSEDYADKPGCTGTLYFTQEEMDEFVWEAHRRGLQVSVHAIGDMAIECILSAYEKAQAKMPDGDRRHRIEHFELPTEDHIARALRLGLIISVQPAYEHFWGGDDKMYRLRLGENRCRKTNPFNTMIKSGLLLIGGSDSDVTPMNPILGIHSAVNHPSADQRISPLEALKMFTINAAAGVFAEETKGSIEPGKIADFAVLDKNPLEVRPEKIKDIKVDMTFKDGNLLFTRRDLCPV